MSFATDKIAHGYLPTYLRLASQIGTAGRILEIGVDKGESLRMWQHLFPDGLIVGVDLHESKIWPRGTVKVIAEQDSLTMTELVYEASSSYDLIVDDASHDGVKSRRTWELLWPFLVPSGWYVLEDWMVGLDGWPDFDDSMLKTAAGFLELLTRDSDVESIEYRYGMAILRKRR